MSDDTLSQLVTQAIAASVGRNFGPILKWLYATFTGVIISTVFVVGMVYDVRAGIQEAKREAGEAKALVEKLSTLVLLHDKQIGIFDDRSRKGGSE